MTAGLPLIPDSAPFSAEQRSWLNGFLAGVFSQGTAPGAIADLEVKDPLLLLFGSQSGNAESLAKKLGKEASKRGFLPRVAGMEMINPEDLAKEKNVMIISSTWGEGEMPDNAAGFWEGLNQNGSSPNLTGVRFSVLALGDMNYGDTFCLAGKRLDQRLAELGANRIHDRVDCDVDFDGPAKHWSSAVFTALKPSGSSTALLEAPVEEEESLWSRKNPFPAKLLANRCLNEPSSSKDTRHIELSLEGSGLEYEVGDALGLYPKNCPGVVSSVIEKFGFDPNAMVALTDGHSAPLHEALLTRFEIRSYLSKEVKFEDVQTFVAELRKLQPRLYSISSSPKAHPNEVHLTVGAVRYQEDGLTQKGVASTFLADRLSIGGTAGVFIHKANHFRLPASGETPVIMVGPGTGIAPFRAFLEEREAVVAKGDNWLFFGDQRESVDFLYRDQIERWQRSGFLTRLALAFSRDQKDKIYVQNRMLEHAAELWKWLEAGAHFYVCGDASRMAKDVEAALLSIAETEGKHSPEAAASYLSELKKSKRYQRDVY